MNNLHKSEILANDLINFFRERNIPAQQSVAAMFILLLQIYEGAETASEQLFEFEQALLALEHEPIEE